MIQFTFGQVILGTFTFTTLLGLIQWLLAKWIAARLEKSIQHEYDKKLEDYRFAQLQRQKAEVIARLFSKWAKYRGKEIEYLSKDQLLDYYEELSRMSFELAMWVKDGNLLNDIMARLQNKEGAKDPRVLVGEIRKLILENNAKDIFDCQQITLWPTDEVMLKLFNK